MRHLLLFIFAICASQAFTQSKSYDYAYTSQKGICVYSLAEKKEYFITKDGADPSISPDGRKLAYTLYGDGGSRVIQILDLNTKVKTTLNKLSKNCFGPVWSPDGKSLAYNVLINFVWHIAIFDLDKTEHNSLVGKIISSSPARWTIDSKYLIVHDMKNVTLYSLLGSGVAVYNMKDMVGGLPELKEGVGHSSSDRFLFSQDTKKIVFNTDIDDPMIKSEEGMSPAIFIYDILSKKTSRLSPKAYSAFEPVIKGQRIFFSASKGNSIVISVYSIDMDGNNFKCLFPGCRDISVRN